MKLLFICKKFVRPRMLMLLINKQDGKVHLIKRKLAISKKKNIKTNY